MNDMFKDGSVTGICFTVGPSCVDDQLWSFYRCGGCSSARGMCALLYLWQVGTRTLISSLFNREKAFIWPAKYFFRKPCICLTGLMCCTNISVLFGSLKRKLLIKTIESTLAVLNKVCPLILKFLNEGLWQMYTVCKMQLTIE